MEGSSLDDFLPDGSHEDDMDMNLSSGFDTPNDDFDRRINELDKYAKRELRPQTNRGAQVTSWLDMDDTGNYDPSQERRVKRVRPRPNTKTKPACGQEKEKREKPPTEIPKLIVSLAFRSEEGKNSFTTEIDSRLAAEQGADRTGYKLRTRPQDEESNNAISDIDPTAKPFARGCRACVAIEGDSGESQCSLLRDEQRWPCESCEEADLDCHMVRQPERKRACEQCKSRRITCSYTYTRNHTGDCCLQCKAGDRRCLAGPDIHFIKPRIRLDRDWEIDPLPTNKKGKNRALGDCYECKQADRPCHFDPEDDGGACLACKSGNDPCTIGAGPPPSSQSKKRKRATEQAVKDDEARDPKTTEEPSTEEKREGANQRSPESLKAPITSNTLAHRPAKKQLVDIPKTTITNALPFPPQQRVHSGSSRATNGSCQPHRSRLPGFPHQSNGYSHQSQIPPDRPPPQRPSHHPVGEKKKAMLRKIRTNYCHPIHFNCDEHKDEYPDPPECSFCVEPTLAIFGLGLGHVTVVDWQNNTPFVEIKGGHKSHNVDETRLCSECTTQRIEILICPEHSMAPIPGTEDLTDEMMQEAMNQLFKGHMYSLETYCALCANLAQYECCAGREQEEGGCGLRLCEGCTIAFEGQYTSNLQAMLLANVRAEPTESAPLGLRADAELLIARRSSALNRFVRSLRQE